MKLRRTELPDGFALHHEKGRLEVHELAPGVMHHVYYGVVVDEYWELAIPFTERALAASKRLTLLADVSRAGSSPTTYRHNWANWYNEHADVVDDFIILVGSTVSRMAIRALNVLVDGSVRTHEDVEAFQADVEAAIQKAWDRADATSEPYGHDPTLLAASTPAEAASSEPGDRDATGRMGLGDEGLPSAFDSPVDRRLALDALNAALFGSAAIQSASTIGRFAVKHHLGRGGMGVVYACHDRQLDRNVAVKQLRSAGDEGAQRRLLREAKAMARIAHPNVATIYEIGESEGFTFLAMELIDGLTLCRWIAAEERSPAEILRVFVDAARGLEAAHEKGLVHRDFKPSNVMVTESGRVVVMDFGLARALGDHELSEPGTERRPSLTEEGVIIGTPAYMAPEQFLAASTDERTDQFSFCVALWEALCGERPHPGDGFSEISGAVVRGEKRAFRDVGLGRELEEILDRGLATAPRDRHGSMRELREALERLDLASTPRGKWSVAVVALGIGSLAVATWLLAH